MSARLPPFWLIAVTQIMSTIGDAFGQRVIRVDHKGSRRRMLLAMTVFTAVQVAVLLGAAQLFMPAAITGAVYNGHSKLACYHQTDVEHRDVDCDAPHANCTRIPCPPQGPASIFPAIAAHPKLLLDQVLNIFYYFTEALLYKEPLGLIFLVIASLASSFLISPIQALVGLPTGDPIPVVVYVLGIGGALLALIERRAPPPPALRPPPADVEASLDPARRSLLASPAAPFSLNDAHSAALPGAAPSAARPPSLWAQVWAWLGLFIPFALLALAYATYFVAQRYFADRYRLNAFGYTSLDQTLLPFSFYPFIACIALVPGASSVLDSGADVNEPLLVSIRAAFAELSIFNMWNYRFFLNARAFVYFYLAVEYDLSRVYLELTLTRILLSWLGSLAITLAFPSFIHATPAERASQLAPFNLLWKGVGSILILFSMLRLNHVI